MSADERPVVVTRDGWIISGDAALADHRAAGRTHGRAIVVDVDYETADEEVRDRLDMLAVALRSQEIDELEFDA